MPPASSCARASEGMHDIARAACVSGWPVVGIVKALLAERLVRVECVDPELRFRSILVDPAEVRAVLSREASEDFVCVDEVARMLRIRRYAVSSFLKLRDPSGAAYLRAHFVQSAEDRRTRVFSKSEVMKFLDEHITLSEIAAQSGSRTRWVKPKLDARGIGPIATASEVRRYYYRRSDVAGIMPL